MHILVKNMFTCKESGFNCKVCMIRNNLALSLFGGRAPKVKTGAHLGGRGDTSPDLKKKSVFEKDIYPENAQ